MLQIFNSDTPIEKNIWYINTKQAEVAASRKLGKNWRQRGYQIESVSSMLS